MEKEQTRDSRFIWAQALVAVGAAAGFVGELSSLQVPKEHVGAYIKDGKIEALEPGKYFFGEYRFPKPEIISAAHQSSALVRLILRDPEQNFTRELDIAVDYQIPDNLTPVEAFKRFDSRLYNWKIGNLCLKLLEIDNLEITQDHLSQRTFREHEEFLMTKLAELADVKILNVRLFFYSDEVTYLIDPSVSQTE